MVPLYGDLTVGEYLAFIAESRGVPKDKRRNRIGYALETCGLLRMEKRRIEALSKGYKQRTALAQAIIHDPPILILDEPTTGLDPNQIIEIRSLIKELGQSKTVILSTHILQEVEAVCSRVLILNDGRIAAQGTAAEIGGAIKGGETWEVCLKLGAAKPRRRRTTGDGQPDLTAARGALPEALGALEKRIGPFKQNKAEETDGLVDFSFFVQGRDDDPGADVGEAVFDWAVEQGFKILRMGRQRLSLEEIFVKLTHGDSVGSGVHNENQEGV
jgi:ABC-2 type transport system ATP-binding protein